ncbi:hypothetical protein ANOM_010625 [Aspergillus nomiae NRRL 13137]|uniref:Uncharacterized protein n=1 Tax=Aspergillus nomiae NRRL (strain ATCC 15546 / NRRL 13137 / CBS 260.88 / M93) TaxID=1509407 RepID=A0A0L1IMH1_ASPN3|nr:uncharacterized protein ANOM_010625 [Aspergillus nomiae NRRL 13137]KNG80455.1 hypothetical protein ANOM_010625 [Aspergillus nomiae NRRL 13137]
MAAARLRKAFHYPDDSGDNEHEREELDEEEQELVINRLRVQNDKHNAEFTVTFTAIPLLSVSVFIPSVIKQGASLQERFLTCLGILSLITTAYTMKYFPFQHPDLKGKGSMRSSGTIITHFRKLLLPVNTAICGMLLLVWLFTPVEPPSDVQPKVYFVPGGECFL